MITINYIENNNHIHNNDHRSISIKNDSTNNTNTT